MNNQIRLAVESANLKEAAIRPFSLYGRGHEPRVSLDRSLAAILKGTGIFRIYISSHHRPSLLYPARVFVRAAKALRRKLGPPDAGRRQKPGQGPQNDLFAAS